MGKGAALLPAEHHSERADLAPVPRGVSQGPWCGCITGQPLCSTVSLTPGQECLLRATPKPSAHKPTSERVSQGTQDTWQHGEVKAHSTFQKVKIVQGCPAAGCGGGECAVQAPCILIFISGEGPVSSFSQEPSLQLCPVPQKPDLLEE